MMVLYDRRPSRRSVAAVAAVSEEDEEWGKGNDVGNCTMFNEYETLPYVVLIITDNHFLNILAAP